LLVVELWFSFIFGMYNGAMIPLLTEIMPFEVRTAGFSLAFSLATALFGGFTPAVSTYLIHATGNPASPALWFSLVAVLALIAAIIARRYDPSLSGVDPDVEAVGGVPPAAGAH